MILQYFSTDHTKCHNTKENKLSRLSIYAHWTRHLQNQPLTVYQHLTPQGKDPVRTAELTHSVSVTKTSQSVLHRETDRCVFWDPHTTHKYILWKECEFLYGLDGPGIEFRWRRYFLQPVQTGPGANPASCTTGTRSLSPGVKRPGRDFVHSHSSSAGVDKNE
jgi:hypothetical protein